MDGTIMLMGVDFADRGAVGFAGCVQTHRRGLSLSTGYELVALVSSGQRTSGFGGPVSVLGLVRSTPGGAWGDGGSETAESPGEG